MLGSDFMTAISPVRAAKWLGLVYLAALALFMMWNADAPDSFVLSLLFLPWMIGPVALAAVGARMSLNPSGAWAFLSFEAGIVGFTTLSWLWLIFAKPDAQNGIAMAFTVPVLEYAATLALFGLSYLLGWRTRSAPLGD
jgi:hypothetical protein